MVMSAAYRADDPPGPAGRWFIEQLRQLTGDEVPAYSAARSSAVGT